MLDQTSFSLALPRPFSEFLGDLAALGVSPVSTGGIAYGLLGARSNARWWVLPLAQGRVSSASIAMYQPMSFAAGLAKLGIKAALRLGLNKGWTTGELRFDRLPKLPGGALPAAQSCAYFTGTDGPHRKTAIQLMDGAGHILGYAKLSRRPSVRPYLAREAQMLDRMNRLSLQSADIPAVLAFQTGDADEPMILVTDSRKASGVASPLDPGQVHLRFLREMQLRTGGRGAHSAYAELGYMSGNQRLPDAWAKRFRAGVRCLAPFVATLPVALAHGDFTPWNGFVLKDRLYVFDWEYASDAWPVGYDLVHYHLAARGMGDPQVATDYLTDRVAEALLDGDMAMARVAVLMSLLLHAALYLRRTLDEKPHAGLSAQHVSERWPEGAARSRLIDVLLHQLEGVAC